jgi:sporulation protein YlmC with PRC-barrel domain
MTDLDGKREFDFPDIRRWEVLNTTGHRVGKVEEVFVDPNTLEPKMALLHYQKFMNRNTKKLLVPWSEIQIVGSGQVRTRPTEEQIADAPDWDEANHDWSPANDYWNLRTSSEAPSPEEAVETRA